MKKTLGIIAGNGNLPVEVAKAYIQSGGEVLIAKLPGIDGNYDGYNSQDFKIGKISPIFNYFKQAGIENIVIIGAFKRPSLKGINVDAKGAILLTRVLKAMLFGDDKLLRVIAEFIEENGFHIISALSILPEHVLLQPGIASGNVSDNININIEIGFKAAKDLGERDIGQAVIVKDNVIIGREDNKGTNDLIKRCSGTGGILVKTMKPNQDERLDIPTIGIETINNAAEAGLIGIAIEAGKVIVVDSDAVVAKAKELGLFVIGV